jgi:4-hydroxybenzoyl-CoA reductase subunit beta
MTLPDFDHFEPETIEEACRLLKDHGTRAKVIAGGTDLINLMRCRLVEPQVLVDLKNIPQMKQLTEDERTGLHIGAAVSLSETIRSPLVQARVPLLAEACRSVAVPAIRNMATLGGNICLGTRCFFYNQSRNWRSSRSSCLKAGGTVCHVVRNSKSCHSAFQADAACALVALNARVRLIKENATRILPLSEFYDGKGEVPNVLEESEILTEIIVPCQSSLEGTYEKFGVRGALDFPQVGVAVALVYNAERMVHEIRLALNGVAPRPVEINGDFDLSRGRKLDENLIERIASSAYEAAHPVDNTGLPPLYRKKMVKVMTIRALRKLSLLTEDP